MMNEENYLMGITKKFESEPCNKYLDFSKDKDAWGRSKYKHSHVQSLFDGYLVGCQSCVTSKV